MIIVTTKLPSCFRVGREERDLPVGEPIKGGLFVLSLDDAREYLDDAEHYASKHGPDCLPPGLRPSARATIAPLQTAIREAAK